MRLLNGKLRIKPSEASSLHTTLLDQLSVQTNALTYQSFKLCKYCSEIWLCTAALASPTHLTSLVKVAVTLKETGEHLRTPGMQMAMLVLLLVHLHALGTFYNAQGILDYTSKLVKSALPRDLYPGLFERERWDLVCSFGLRLFRKQQYPIFERTRGPVPFNTIPILDLLKESFPQAAAEEVLSPHSDGWRDSVDPLDTVNSDSSVSSRMSDIGNRIVEVGDIKPEFVTGSAAVARQEEEQQGLIQRLITRS